MDSGTVWLILGIGVALLWLSSRRKRDRPGNVGVARVVLVPMTRVQREKKCDGFCWVVLIALFFALLYGASWLDKYFPH